MSQVAAPSPPRLAAAQAPAGQPRLTAVAAARAAVAAIVAAFMVLFLWGGTPESRILYPVMLLIGVLNPVWALYALALYGPLFLFDASNTHLLVGLEVLVLGAIAGEARLWGRPDGEAHAMAPAPRADGSPAAATHAPQRLGLWPAWCVALLCVLAGSAVMGIRLVLQREDDVLAREDRVLATLMNIYYGSATGPDWGLRALHNWVFGMALGTIALRRATPLRAARWLKFGGLGLVTACAVSILDRVGVMNLDAFRRPNPDPLHVGRLQGLAGHAGWFGQWIVLYWSGVALWWVGGAGRPRRVAVAVALGIVGLALLMTGARAPWLGAAAGGALLGGWLGWRRPEYRKLLLGVGVASLLAVAVAQAAFGIMDRVVEERITHVLRVTDRARYYVSSLELLREQPLGIGLGTHWLAYSDRFPPWYRYYQPDHVDSHSLYLHTLLESGPAALALLLLGIAWVARDTLCGWPSLGGDSQRTVLALAASFAGILLVGFAQYLPYIRAVELSLWVLGGFLVGIARREGAARFGAPRAGAAPVLIAAGAAAGLLMAGWHAQRPLSGSYPRDHYRWNEADKGFSFWTSRTWRMPVHANVREIRFTLMNGPEPQGVILSWPDGSVDRVELGAGEYRAFARTVAPEPASPFARPRWLRIDAGKAWRPAERDPSSKDHRLLGVYVIGLDATTTESAP